MAAQPPLKLLPIYGALELQIKQGRIVGKLTSQTTTSIKSDTPDYASIYVNSWAQVN
jgi:hypothetical protein